MEFNNFSNQSIKDFLEWSTNLNKKNICEDFIDESELNDVYIIFNVNGIQDDYYDIPLKNFDNIKEDLIYALQSEFEFIDEDLNPIIPNEMDYTSEDVLYFIDIYIENRETGLKILYGTYYSDGFEEKYEIINDEY